MTAANSPGLGQPTEPAGPGVDFAQQQVMTAISPDGRPPEIARTRTEWKWFVLAGVPLGVLCIGILIFNLGPAAGLLAVGLFAGYLALTVPVWGAGLLRGKEERIARKEAQAEVVAEHHPE